MKIKTSGFTLIELLVVIAIIGILSSVVLASLGNARTRSADASIKATLMSVRGQIEIYYTNNNGYGTPVSACGTGMFADPIIARAVSAMNSSSGLSASCRSVATAWAVSSPLKSSGHWCIDSTGVSGARATAITTTAC